jgi:cellulose synthase/poly-beta-1,6-N-acetylglucosamine synthase-like glycosyltransferase
MEWILVNDRSTDRTEQIMTTFVEKYNHARVITLNDHPKKYTGKCYGLIRGVKMSRGEILFFTDADCVVPPNWIQSTLSGYEDNTGMVGGFVVLDTKGEKTSLFQKLQSLDWINITAVGSAWANLNQPLSVFGNNFSIKKEVYEKAGGFESVENHFIEDYALVRNVRSRTNQTIRIHPDRENLVYTRPAESLKAFYLQRKRWAVGGRSHVFLGLFLMTIAFLVHLLIPTVIISGQTAFGLLAFFDILILDTFFLYEPLRKLGRSDLLKYMIPYELFYFGYSIFFAPLLLFARKIQWKSSVYKTENY